MGLIEDPEPRSPRTRHAFKARSPARPGLDHACAYVAPGGGVECLRSAADEVHQPPPKRQIIVLAGGGPADGLNCCFFFLERDEELFTQDLSPPVRTHFYRLDTIAQAKP